MIRVIAGGKKHASWLAEACVEYEKRLRKPFVVEWQFVDEEKLEVICDIENVKIVIQELKIEGKKKMDAFSSISPQMTILTNSNYKKNILHITWLFQ